MLFVKRTSLWVPGLLDQTFQLEADLQQTRDEAHRGAYRTNW